MQPKREMKSPDFGHAVPQLRLDIIIGLWMNDPNCCPQSCRLQNAGLSICGATVGGKSDLRC